MRKELRSYLGQVYRRDILGESVSVEMPQVNPELVNEVKAEIKRIDDLRFGAMLANRDFALYQRRRALGRLLQDIEAYQERPEEVKQLAPPEGAEDAANPEG